MEKELLNKKQMKNLINLIITKTQNPIRGLILENINKMKICDKIQPIIIDNMVVNKIPTSGYGHFFYIASIGNCKHATINNISMPLYSNKVQAFKLLDEVFESARKLAFTVNVTDIKYVNILKEHFTFIDMVELPLGYGNGNQYHATFFTNYRVYSNRTRYMDRVVKYQQEKVTSITPAFIEKVLSYSSKAWLKKYLLKIS